GRVGELDVVLHFGFARLGIHTQIVEVTLGVVDGVSRGRRSAEFAEGDRALELGFVLIAIYKFVDVADGHPHVELAGDRACGVTGGRDLRVDGEIALASGSRSGGAGEIPANHLLVEGQADAIRKLHVQEWFEKEVSGQVRSSARERVIET